MSKMKSNVSNVFGWYSQHLTYLVPKIVKIYLLSLLKMVSEIDWCGTEDSVPGNISKQPKETNDVVLGI